MTGLRPAESDPIFSLRWSWWRRPASMRWVGDGFEGHMATAIWTWIASRPVAAGIGLMAAGALLLGAWVAPFLAIASVVVGARALTEAWTWQRALAASLPMAIAAQWIHGSGEELPRTSPLTFVVYAAAVGVAARRPWIAVSIAAAPTLGGIARWLLGSGLLDIWVLSSAPLFCLVSIPPRVVGFGIAALFCGAMIAMARADLGGLVTSVSHLVLLFPATAILRAANEPYSGADPTTRWVAAAHRRPWMAAAAWIGLSFAVAVGTHSHLRHPALPAVMFAVAAWTGSHLVGGARSVVGRFAAVVLSGPLGGALAVVLVGSTLLRLDPYRAAATIALGGTCASIAGMVRWRSSGWAASRWLIPCAVVGGVVAWAWMPSFDPELPIPGQRERFDTLVLHSSLGAGVMAGAWMCICVSLALAARSRTTVPDDHPIHQLRELRERRARGEA